MAEALIGPYRPTLRLSADAESERWAAWDTRLNRRVELTVLPRLARASKEGPALFKGFVQELRQLTGLRHPNVQTPQEFAPLHEAQAWYVTEPIAAITLRAFEDAVRRLPWTQAAAIARELAEGLAYAHERGVTHGNLRPEAVLLERRGRLKINRFAVPLKVLFRQNLAALEGLDGVSAERLYLAPEVLGLREPDASSDLFSLGVVMYEMVTGQRPFSSEQALHDHGERMANQPPDPWAVAGHIPQALRDLIRDLLAPAPKRRPKDMVEARQRLDDLLASEGIGDVAADLERSFARQASIFDGDDDEATRVIAAVDAETAPVRARTQPMTPLKAAGDGPKRTRTQPMGQIKRSRTQPMRMMKLSAEGAAVVAEPAADGDAGPVRPKTTTRFEAVSDDEVAAAEQAREGGEGASAGHARQAPAARSAAPPARSAGGGPASSGRVLRILEREGYLKKKPRQEVSETRAIVWLMVLIGGMVVGLYFLLQQRVGDRSVDEASVSSPSQPSVVPEGGRSVEELEASGVTIARAPTEDPQERSVQRAEAMLEAGNPALAEQAARTGLVDGDRDPRLHMALGRALAGQGKVDAAVAALVVADDHQADAAAVAGHLAAAALLEQQERWAEALALYTQAYERGAESAEVMRSLAHCHLELGQDKAAEAALDRFVNLKAGQREELLVLAELKDKHGKAAAAADLYRAVLALDPKNAKAKLGLTRLVAGSSAPAAATALVDAKTADPAQLAAAADGAFKAKRFAQAATLFARAVAAHGADAPAWLLLNHAAALDRAGRDAAAIKAYARVIAKDPRNTEAHFRRGRVLARYGRTRDAIEAFERVEGLDRRNWKAPFEVGLLQLQRSRWRDAAAAFHNVLKRKPNHPSALQNLAKAQFEGGDRRGAVDTFKRLARVRPGDPTPLLTAAGLLKMMRQPEEAAAILAEACRRGAREACQ